MRSSPPAVVPTPSSASVTASDRPVGRHRSAAAGLPGGVAAVCGRVGEPLHFRSIADCSDVIVRSRDTVRFTAHFRDDVTRVGHDGHVMQAAARPASRSALYRRSVQSLWLRYHTSTHAVVTCEIKLLGRSTYTSADSFFRYSSAIPSALAERNSTKTGHMLGSELSAI